MPTRWTPLLLIPLAVACSSLDGSPAPPADRTAAGSTATRVLPLGDSITQGDRLHLSYRDALWRGLREGGFAVDLVGTQRSHYRGEPPHPDPSFDPDHEGHWGWRADQLLAELPGWLEAISTPDVALVHVGTNDVFDGQPTEETLGEIAGIVVALRTANPDIAVLLARPVPTADPAVNDRLAELGAGIDQLAASLNSDRSPVRRVDADAGFDGRHDTYDGVHPNADGAQKLAAAWLRALSPLLANPSR